MFERLACVGLFCLFALPSFAKDPVAPAGATNEGAAANWLTHGGDTDETHYSRLKMIDTSNIERLGLQWSLDLPGEASLAGTPLAVDGVLYFTGDHAAVYAVEATTGKLLWRYDPELWKSNPAGLRLHYAYTHGPAYADGRVFACTLDGHLFALDAKSGDLLWSVQTLPADPPDPRMYTSGAPRVFNGKVILGNSGGDAGARGYVTAYEAATGKFTWRFYVTPGSPDENKDDPAQQRAAATWGTGEFWKTGTGGGPWDSIVFDQALNQIYVATGNPIGTPPDVRSPGGGDNLYTSSIVALNADTGRYVWHYQIDPRDGWDYDATEQITLAELRIHGKRRPVLMQAPKNGFFYVIDRKSGKVISAEKYSKVTWADHIDLKTGRPVETPHIREPGADVWPGSNGAHSWQAMSFSPKSGLVYIPGMQNGVHFGVPGGMGTGFASSTDPRNGKGALIAWDPVQQREAWYVQHTFFFNGGTLSTGGGLVFQGTADGNFTGYDDTTGRQVWQFYAGIGIISAPISYEVAGKQYISVLAGYGASAGAAQTMRVGWKYRMPRRLMTFALDAHAMLPSVATRDLNIKPVDDPNLEINPTDAAAGAKLGRRCWGCHGGNLQSAGTAPDLRESTIALDPQSFWAVVHDGALIQNGMPRFDNFTRDEVNQIRAYIRTRAREALSTKPPEAKANSR